jgi:aspartyl-tRNA(Asn)/glutamyl-tRNA(Gln) amidotransferase subunit A
MDELDICYLTAIALRERYRRRELSPVEVTEAVLDRIVRHDPELKAFVTVTPEEAMRAAQAAEQAYATGGAGRLAGIPISIKDLTPTKEIRTTLGSLIYQDWVPDGDAPFVERVRAAGAVLLGKTNTPEFGWKADSTSRVIGSTQNPWLRGRTAGGSSGGAAAAVAAGLGPLAQGSDGGGSIRIPAAFCGIFGLKPTAGTIAFYPPSRAEPLSHMGPMARTVRDAALLLTVTAGIDYRDRQTFPSTDDYLAACEGSIAGLRIAWVENLGHVRIDPEVLAITRAAAARFSELGCQVEEARPTFPDPTDAVDTILAVSQAGAHRDDFDQVRELIDPGRLPLIECGFRWSALELLAAHQHRHACYLAVQEFLQKYDLLLTPVVPVSAFPAGQHHPEVSGGEPVRTYLSWLPQTSMFNLTGNPAASLPCGFDRLGLPVGLQVIGRWRDDATLLRACAAFEELAPWSAYRPPLD